MGRDRNRDRTVPSFAIDKRGDIPIWVQIKQYMVHRIVSGAYKPGDQLPTVRELACALDVNYHTVNKVYRELEGMGLIEVKIGNGSFVAQPPKGGFILLESDATAAVAEYAAKLTAIGMTPTEIVTAMARHLGVPVTIGGQQTEKSENAEGMLRYVG